jgi:ABC-type phosphate/phosphonate transport system substrate-binding protein
MVVTKQAEAAAVDANALACNKKYLQDGGKDIQVLESIGPLPSYPIVVNTRLNGEHKCCLQSWLF